MMVRGGLVCLVMAFVAGTAVAQQSEALESDDATIPAPDYFITAAMTTTTAQILAQSCTTLSINPVAMMQSTDGTLDALSEDGFTAENLATRMQDPSDQIAVLQRAFLEKHGLSDGATEDVVCAAGLQEIIEGTDIGALLVEVEE